MRRENEQLRYWLGKEKTFVEVGTSPFKPAEIDRIFTTERSTNLDSLNHLNHMLELLAGSLEEENGRRKEQMGEMERRMRGMEKEREEEGRKLGNIT